jgi:hypothetical protein
MARSEAYAPFQLNRVAACGGGGSVQRVLQCSHRNGRTDGGRFGALPAAALAQR